MKSGNRFSLFHLTAALEALLLLALLFLLTPAGKQAAAAGAAASAGESSSEAAETEGEEGEEGEDRIRWVDFDVTAEAMKQAFRYDVDTYLQEVHLRWIELLAYLGAKYGGDFSLYQPADMDAAAERLLQGESMEAVASGMQQYPYYLEAYEAVLGGMVGEYRIEIPASEAPDFAAPKDQEGNPLAPEERTGKVWVTKYGLKAFSPIAKNFAYTDYDDFGTSRSYGYSRRHLGHDLLGQVGTPVIAVESGYVEVIGWNTYGGWRLGIRSLDGKRYYYYAHLRQNAPYHTSVQEGGRVQAGDVIGYLGRTGYSTQENTNNIEVPHLHFGIQLIFGDAQREEEPEIWIDCYELVRFLEMNRSETVRDGETKEHSRVYQMEDLAVR